MLYKDVILSSLSAIKSAAVLEGAQTSTFGGFYICFIQFATIVATTKVFPVPGGPWMIESLSYKANATASLYVLENVFGRPSTSILST